MQRLCPKCRKRPKKDNQSYCGECRRAYVRTYERTRRARRPGYRPITGVTRSPQYYVARNKARRLRALHLIGGGQVACVRCGCDDPRFLEINHKNGGGGVEERTTKGGNTAMMSAILSGKRSTTDLELLCRPCNAIHYLELKFGITGLAVVWSDNAD